jgi:hypothetical protein
MTEKTIKNHKTQPKKIVGFQPTTADDGLFPMDEDLPLSVTPATTTISTTATTATTNLPAVLTY